MAQNFKKDGKTIKWVNTTGSAVASGTPVVIAGGKVCAALETIADTATGILKTDGVWEFPKATPLAIAQGDKVFWDGTKVTKTVTDTFIGTCHEAAVSAATTVLIDIEDAAGGTQMPYIAPIATADGSDAATTQALANATKAKVNSILASLVASGRMDGN